ncbi:MAG: ABC transporter substrate-binding protein [Desulfobulbaceae bacterium]|nr:ABC transporter substrate-binding protein [Desulfobulbaceae bacterium]
MIKIIYVFTLLLIFSPAYVSGGENGPTDTLKPVLNELMAILGDKSLEGDENLVKRRSKIMISIGRGFNFKEMSKRVLGKTWRTIDDQQKEYFTELMTKLLENVYVGKLEGYSDQTVEFVAEKIKGDRAQVTTFLVDKGMKLPVHYIMKTAEELWLVYDINIEGVSLVRNYQQQFKSIIRKEKFEGLVKVLEEKNRSFLKAEN